MILTTSFLLACGDDGGDNQNNIVSPDFGRQDMATGDMASDMNDDMQAREDMGTEDAGLDMDPGPQPAVVVMPDNIDLQPMRSVETEATYFDVEGVEVPDVTFTWSSGDETIATVDEFGTVTGVGAGRTNVFATADTDGTQGSTLVYIYTANTNLSVGRAHSCTSKVDKRVTCWGDTSLGQLAQTEDLMPRISPIRLDIFPPGVEPTTVGAGSDHNCAIDAEGAVHCWGRNHRGQLGNGSTMTSPIPLRNSFTSPTQSLVMGQNFTCAHLEDKTLRCWGENQGRVLEDSTDITLADPVRTQPNATFDRVVAGSAHICALSGTDIVCWGSNANSQLGPNGTTDSNTPVAVPGQFVNIFAGYDMTCGHTFADTFLCWGANPGGLGDGTTESATPIEVTFPNGGLSTAAIGANHTCAIADGVTYCWGLNDRGQVGDDSRDTRDQPVPVANGTGFRNLSLGEKHSCARTPRGDVFCWGSNLVGQLGDGSRNDQRVPTYVIQTAN